MRKDDRLVFEKSKAGKRGYYLPNEKIPEYRLNEMFEEDTIRSEEARLPELSEVEVVRHYTNLSKLNHSIDNGFYPLGSCTMKYNPKLNETVAAIGGLKNLHPYQPVKTIQGSL